MSDVLDSLRAFVTSVVRDELAKTAAPAQVAHLSVAAYARRWSISERTVRDAIREGRLEHARIGRAVRVVSDARIGPRADAATARARLVLLHGKR